MSGKLVSQAVFGYFGVTQGGKKAVRKEKGVGKIEAKFEALLRDSKALWVSGRVKPDCFLGLGRLRPGIRRIPLVGLFHVELRLGAEPSARSSSSWKLGGRME